MPTRKTGGRKTTVRRTRGTAEVLREAWASSVAALGSAEAEVQKQIKGLLKRNRIGARDAASVLKQFRARVDRERKKALKQLDGRLAAVRARVRQERKVVGHKVDQAVKRGLAAFNIPSRQEVKDLTHKVEELSRKIDAFKRRR